jgi:anti-sigma B factor antagonist
MNITIQESNGSVLISIEGDIESTTIRPFNDQLENIINYHMDVRLDLAGVNYIDSSGIRALLTLMRRLKEDNRTLMLINSSDNIRRILQLSSLQKVLKFS